MKLKTYVSVVLSIIILCLGTVLIIPRAMMLQGSAMENNSANGWVQYEDGSWGYVEDGQIVEYEWRDIDSAWYWFDEDGVMQTSWFLAPDGDEMCWYYALSNGKLMYGWLNYQGSMYYLDEQYGGKMAKEWRFCLRNEGRKWSYFFDNGIMAKDCYIEGYENEHRVYYYVDEYGVWED